jgi:hypothetical protein
VQERWTGALRSLSGWGVSISGLLRGAATRLLMDDGELAADEVARLMGLALSRGTAPQEAAAWIEGFLAGGGMLLVHDERLLGLVDGWLAEVPGEVFEDVLPLLRRTFAEFEPGVRRSVGELVRRGTTGTADVAAEALTGFGAGLDEMRADGVLPALRLLLGTEETA